MVSRTVKIENAEGLHMRPAEVTFECDGEDEAAAMAKIEELESQNFGE